jgi:bifunctional UDP-N-acetylglucosamine pyrophosphorylase/glucosamine-1-phosphate N-acetyltransferase
MKDKDFSVLILAAGLGTRMNSNIPKVLHKFDERPLIEYVLDASAELKPKKIILVIGYKSEMVVDFVNKWRDRNLIKIPVIFVKQKLLKGSGRAVYEAIPYLKGTEKILILSGDVPLIKSSVLSKMLKVFDKTSSDTVVLTCKVSDVKKYGRIIRDEDGGFKSIVEAEVASESQLKINEINSGIYVFKKNALVKALKKLKPKGPKKEYYLTDCIELINKDSGKTDTIVIEDEMQITGVNSRKEISILYKKMNEAKIEELLNEGVSIIDPENTYIAIDVKIGKDTVIYPGCVIKAGTSIGENCIIGHYSLIDNSKICDNVEIKPFSCIFQSVIKNFSTIGPFSHLRPNSVLAEKTKVGNFSEVKKSIIGRGSKVPHLSYIGDSEIGEGVNIGAGTITCNYDGKEKHKTIIEDGAFIGSNTNLVAPVRVGKRALIGAGSTITEDIPDDKLAIARAKQVIKEKRIK